MERQTKRTNNDLQNTPQKTKDLVTWTHWWGEHSNYVIQR